MISNVLLSNWKRISLGSIILGFGIHSIKSELEIQTHMRSICNIASKYGETNNKMDKKKILVLINPIANKGKSEKNFKAYCEPILHSAGFTVDSIRTCYAGDAKNYIEKIETFPDAIIVAGGSGTASEVVTGLMRRGMYSCPMVILPLGYEDSQDNKVRYTKNLMNSTFLLLNGKLRHQNVIKYESIDNNQGQSKLIYGLKSFSWGVFRDIDEIQKKYWYFGLLKRYIAVILNAYSDKLSWHCSANLIYSPPCNGCNNCRRIVDNHYNKRWKRFWGKDLHEQTYKINEDCNKHISCCITSSNLSIISICHQNNLCELVTKISILNPGLSFIIQYLSPFENSVSATLKSRTMRIIPSAECKNMFFSIDGEEYEARETQITLIPNVITVYSQDIKK